MADDRPPARSSFETVVRIATMSLVGLGVLVILGGLVVFAAGEALFGSDQGSIDSYNREVLDTCDTPEGSTLLRSYTLDEVDGSGRRLRSLSYVFASPLSADQVADFYGLGLAGRATYVSAERTCKFGNRPWAVVESAADSIWSGPGAEVTDLADPPPETRSFLLLRLFQVDRDGVFGLGRHGSPIADHV